MGSSDARRVPQARKAALAAGGEEQPGLLRAGRWAGSEGKRHQLELGGRRARSPAPGSAAGWGEHQGTRGSSVP